MPLAQRASLLSCAAKPPCRPPASRYTRHHPVLAAKRAGGGGGEPRQVREKVTFHIPGQPSLKYTHLSQGNLIDVLRQLGALGFETGDAADPRLSWKLEDLPPQEDVNVVLATEPPFGRQISNIQAAFDNATRGKEQEVAAYLRARASHENPGVPITTLKTAPFQGADGQDFVQFDAIVRAGSMLYVGEVKRVLSKTSVADLEAKLAKVRLALTDDDASPDLAAALQGVTAARLFLGGETVWSGLTVDDLAGKAAQKHMSMLLPSGQALGLVGAAAAAVPL